LARKSLLLVDADPRSLRVLEVSLRKAGYNLATCGDMKTALETVEYSPPDLIVLDTRLPGPSGFEVVEALRKNADWATIPMIFLSSDTSVESKVRGLQLGVEDYLTKPIYIKEIVARINLTLARVERESVARRSSISKTRFSGSLTDMGLVDLLQTIDISRKSGVLELRSQGRSGMITFRDGQVLDAELGPFFAERAIYRLLLWSEGEFEIDFRPVRVEQRVQIPTQGLLMEGMRRLDEWSRTCEQIPPLQSVCEVQGEELAARLAELPDEINGILKLFDGQRSIQDVVDGVAADDLSTLSAISKLYFEGIVQPTGRIRTLRPPELVGPAHESDSDLVPVTTSAGDVSASASDDNQRTDERALTDEDRLTVPGHASVAPPPMNPGSIVPPSELSIDLGLTDADLGPAMDLGQHGTGTISAGDAALSAALAATTNESVSPATPAYGSPTDSRSGGKRGRQATLLGPGFEPGDEKDSDTESEPSEDDDTEASASEATRQEDVMSKKKRRNRGRVDEVAKAPEVRKPEVARKEAATEDESNVIQFPAKRSVTAAAANDDIGIESGSTTSTSSSASESRRDGEGSNKRDDDTSSRRREERETDKRETDKREEAEAKSDKPLPGELPRVRLDAKDEEEDGLPAEVAKAPPDARPSRDDRRKRKNQTTSSGEIRALGTGDHGVAAEEFFRAPKGAAPSHDDHDDFSDLAITPEMIPQGSTQWRNAAIGIVVVFALAIGGFWYYENVHLPQPVELGHGPPTIPTIPTTPHEPTVATAETNEPTTDVVEAVEPTTDTVEDPDGVDAVEAIEPTTDVVEAVEPTTDVVEAVEPAAGESYESVMAEAEAARRRPSTAIPLYERAIELNPNGTEALAQLSYLLINRGRGSDTRDAAGLAERASTMDSTNSLAWLVLAVARESLGDRTGARAAYRSCVDQGAPGRWQNECRPHAR